MIFEAPDTNRDVIVRYIVDKGTINPTADANWSFAPLRWHERHLRDRARRRRSIIAEVKGVKIEPAGEGADGFARYRITL